MWTLIIVMNKVTMNSLTTHSPLPIFQSFQRLGGVGGGGGEGVGVFAKKWVMAGKRLTQANTLLPTQCTRCNMDYR